MVGDQFYIFFITSIVFSYGAGDHIYFTKINKIFRRIWICIIIVNRAPV